MIGFDNINNYYDQTLKKDRLEKLIDYSEKYKGLFKFYEGDLANKNDLKLIFNSLYFDSKLT